MAPYIMRAAILTLPTNNSLKTLKVKGTFRQIKTHQRILMKTYQGKCVFNTIQEAIQDKTISVLFDQPVSETMLLAIILKKPQKNRR